MLLGVAGASWDDLATPRHLTRTIWRVPCVQAKKQLKTLEELKTLEVHRATGKFS